MKVLFIEGKDGEALKKFARANRSPYRLLYRKEQDLYLLEVWAFPPELETKASQLEGFKNWSFELQEEGSDQIK